VKLGRLRVDTPDGPEPRIVVARGQHHAVDVRRSEALRLERAGVTRSAAARIAHAVVPSSMTEALGAGPVFLEAAGLAVGDQTGDAELAVAGALLAPADPPSIRDFVAFESHFVAGDKAAGRPSIDDVMYELPIYYMTNPSTILGPDAVVPWPSYSRHLDYELEVGIVIGRSSSDLRPEEALEAVAGLTIFNDFTARDIQFREMEGGLGPAKGKHFASALGPWLVTLDEIDIRDMTMRARLNGVERSNGNLGSIMWQLEELVAWASAGETLPVGAVLGTGTVGSGSLFEQGASTLAPFDVVELEIAGIGVLRNSLGEHTEPAWTPTPRVRTIA
jgi:2-keto-4-pentenoate hydratase/2-oxohepta-3-ene-1,7-dioic acid hydratase in catechol pathway